MAEHRARSPAAVGILAPLHAGDGRVLGGLDLAATLRAGRPVVERGLLAEADGGAVIVAMAERLRPTMAARLTAALDTGEVTLERDGLALRLRARTGVIALDEGVAPDERMPDGLAERLAFRVSLDATWRETDLAARHEPAAVTAVRDRLASAALPADILEAICGAALALGIVSLRPTLLAAKAARIAAALAGRTAATEDDAALAMRLVLAPRPTVLPAAPADAAQDGRQPDSAEPEADAGDPPSGPEHDDRPGGSDRDLADVLVAAAQAAIPADLLAHLSAGVADPLRSRASGRSGMSRASAQRGRPIGSRRGELRDGVRLDVIETLRATAPRQALRRREADQLPPGRGNDPRIAVRREDFRIVRFKERSETTTIFVVDASGSSALNRLAEAKGAVELLLAECYIRRDRVALLAFRGTGAELPPTRSLTRAKRCLASLPGGAARRSQRRSMAQRLWLRASKARATRR